MNFQDTIAFSVLQTGNVFRVELEKELVKIGLHAGQVFVLFELWNSDALSQIELAKRLGLSAPTVNRMVKSLAANGFVVCAADRLDGRIRLVHLTPRGAAVRPSVEDVWRRAEERAMSALTATEQLVMQQLFAKLQTGLKG